MLRHKQWVNSSLNKPSNVWATLTNPCGRKEECGGGVRVVRGSGEGGGKVGVDP